MGVPVLLRCVRGLEWVVADEVAERLGVDVVDMTPRQVRVDVPAGAALRELRVPDDVFLEVGETPDHGHRKDAVDPLARDVARLDWRAPMAALAETRGAAIASGARFDVVASFQGRRNFNRYAVEDAVGARIAGPLGAAHVTRSAVRDHRPPPTELTVRVALDGRTTHVGLRAGERPLHRRGYKAATAAGTLHPPVAAAMARIVGRHHRVALDPFAGDGTIPIEMAAAGSARLLLACDLDPVRLRGAAANARHAGASAVRTVVADAGRPAVRAGSVDVVVTNPPWDVSVSPGASLARSWSPFWRALPGLLAPGGTVCLIADEAMGPERTMAAEGFVVGTATRLRLAGRLSTIVCAARPGEQAPALPASLAAARARARTAGLLDGADGF